MYYTALIGNPVEHSVSHILLEELVHAAGIKTPYKHIKVNVETKQDLKKILKSFNTLGFKGINVTLPYKLDVINCVEYIDDAANAIGAINTIAFRTDGYYATNTDWYGVSESISRLSTLRGKNKAVVLGSGGAARAAIYAVQKLGFEQITVMYRGTSTESKDDLINDKLISMQELKTYDSIASTIDGADLIINATSAGMVGMDLLPFNTSMIDSINLSDTVFFDAVFNPIRTPLLGYFADRGAQTVDGLWMMIYQALMAIEFWTIERIDIDITTLKNIHTKIAKEL